LHQLRELGAISKFSDLMNEMLKVVKTSCLSEAQMVQKSRTSVDSDMIEAAIELYQPLGAAYDHALTKDEAIDFDEMINRAVSYVESGKFISRFSHIMVDEYQDISAPRAALVKALKNQNENCVLFGVGDDWQAIYRFAGSDLSFTTDFFDYFGDGIQVELDTTYRFNDRLCATASAFVMRNPNQMVKTLNTVSEAKFASVVLVKTVPKEQRAQVEKVLAMITTQTQAQGQAVSVFLISRFGFGRPEYFEQLNKLYPNLDIKHYTAHKSKGTEADYVIILDMKKGKHGFPSEKVSHPIIETLLPAQDDYLHSEERRLFYVAMTRAKTMVFVMSDAEQPSAFCQELLEYDVATELIAPSPSVANMFNASCPSCDSGQLIKRVAKTRC
jgi:DNA helicase-4